ncbi:FAD-binding oxidoreductase [Nocardioides sp. SR21]|uniref:FAD-binding oxidoreductase n=1 Tax=Nocardioides sp. SR21 TaxID=2919501 RepID=UPI001FA9B7CF|nr:FAD-binding oxidoreductase [Nocardioides sp. SR21]
MTIDHVTFRPGTPEYDAARTTFAGTATPALVLRPTSAADVVAALDHARSAGLPLAVRSGGHNVLGLGAVDDGVVLDLSRLDAVELLGEGRVRIGAGATWGAAAAALAPHGLAVSSGDTTSVGVGGLSQAGGIGWLVRKHGLTVDHLLAAEVVTAAGQVVRASATDNADLFWAVRGGAGNFGVVTAFEFQAHPVTTVHFGTITFAADDVAQLLKGWTAAAITNASDDLTTMLVLMPDFGSGRTALLYVCLDSDDPSPIDALRTIGTVLTEDVRELRYADTLEEAHPPEGVLPVIGNALVGSVDEPLIDAIATAYAGGGRVVFLRSLGGAVARVDRTATAFAHRDAEALVVSAAFLPIDATDNQVAEARGVWRTIGDQGIGAYAGFLGSDSDEDIAALWPADTYARLREVKRAWDPDNVFRRNFNVRP